MPGMPRTHDVDVNALNVDDSTAAMAAASFAHGKSEDDAASAKIGGDRREAYRQLVEASLLL